MRSVFDSPLFQAMEAERVAQAPQADAVSRAERDRANRLAIAAFQRMYASAKSDRLTLGGWSNSSADSELVSSLVQLRSKSRSLVRDAAYARRARSVIMNNVIGTGIGLQAKIWNTRGGMNSATSTAIEEAFRDWCAADSCHTGGELHFHDLERLLLAEVFEAGEVFVRIHPQRFGASEIPLALEIIEAERLADDLAFPLTGARADRVRMGIEQDDYHRPVAYYFRRQHPGETRWRIERAEEVMRVPAEFVIHLKVMTRFPQTRGEPWLHAAIRKLADMDGYTEAEIIAARGAANYLGVTESDDVADPAARIDDAGNYQVDIAPGMNLRLRPGEKFSFIAPNRPNPALDPFMRHMIREVAAATDLSYETVSRDYSQSNYSSSRLALLDDRDAWRALQTWFIRAFRARVHRAFVRQAVIARAIPGLSADAYFSDPKKFEAAAFKPRGWTWIDPAKEIAANKEAVKSGFSTVTQVIAENAGGRDIEDVLEERSRELELFEAAEIVFETSPEFYDKPEPVAAPPGQPASDGTDPGADPEESSAADEPAERTIVKFKGAKS